jgi:hypothetical protein
MSETDLQREINDLRARLDYLQAPDPNPTLSELPATFLALPALRAFWPLNVWNNAGQFQDMSGNGKVLAGANMQVGIYNNLVPYASFNGTSANIVRASEADLQITGALTIGGWFYWNTFPGAGQRGLMGKYDAGTQRSYLLFQDSTPQIDFIVSNTGAVDAGQVNNPNTPTAAAWYFVAGRYTPSTETAIFLNNNKNTNTTSIPASLFSGTAAFQVGSYNSANWMDGRAAACFLCAAALPDTLLSYVFQRTRGIFGV